ncbi:DUF1800 family protein [Psychrobacter sp. P11G5]|uniref:DUF1800 domain-containing protein n=1 Tax=Psychrobacter sp. P11G5 TaxID=1699624 RepID=UPI0008295253|nr:DUF1800 family protein [Psychrobacter sp. P11G5]
MENVGKRASLSTINEWTPTNALKETHLKHSSKRFYPVKMQHPVIASMPLFLIGCGGGGSSSGSSSGSSTAGSSTAGSSTAGSSTAGSSTAGSSTAGSSTTGSSTTGPSTTGPSTTGPSTTGPSTTGPSTTGPSTTSPDASSSNPTSPAEDNIMGIEPLNDINAARFLQQAQFSSTKAEIEDLKSIGISRWLNEQFSMPIEITGYNWLLKEGHNTKKNQYSDRPGDWMAWQQLLSSKDTLRKRMALALSETMVLSTIGLSLPHPSFAAAAYWDLLNKHAFGSFRDLLKSITLNIGMGAYLDLRHSRRANDSGRRPDENYAREVMQLFTIGLVELNLDGTPKLRNGKPIETYNQETVTNIARALTGWTVDNRSNVDKSDTYVEFTRNPMINIRSRHDTRSASFFGVTVPEGTSGEQALDIVIDTLFNHPNVGPFISKQIIQRLVTSNPSPNYVRRVATIFNSDNKGERGNLKSVLEAILTDKEARILPDIYEPTIGKVREPMVRLIQWVHTFSNRQSESGEWMVSTTSSRKWFLNQSPLRAPSVFNFFDMDYTPNTDAFIDNGMVAPELQLHNVTSTVGYINHIKRVIEKGIFYGFIETVVEIAPDYRTEMKLYDQPEELVDHLNLILCGGQMSSKTIGLIRFALKELTDNSPDWKEDRIHLAIFMTMVSPDYLVQK